MSTFTATIQLRADTSANWTSSNPILKSNELGIETDSFTTSGGVRLYKCKLGDETTAWNSLAYANIGQFFAGGGSASVAWGSITGTISSQSDLQTLLDGKLSKSSNLSDLSSVTTARSNIGIGSGYILVTSGTSFTTPSDITTNTKFKITVVGGGGGGGGINTSGSKGSGAGGGAAGVLWISGLEPSTSYSCTIGSGGAGGATPGDGTDGGDTTLTIGATTYTAGGGKKGIGAIGNLGGLGGTVSGFTLNIPGQRGGDSPANSASSTDAKGGDSGLGWGTGGAPARNSSGGRSGDGYGAGGGGGHGASSPGGSGTNGVIYAEYWN